MIKVEQDFKTLDFKFIFKIFSLTVFIIFFSGWFYRLAVQRVPIDHHHRRCIFSTHPFRSGVDFGEPFQRSSVLLLA